MSIVQMLVRIRHRSTSFQWEHLQQVSNSCYLFPATSRSIVWNRGHSRYQQSKVASDHLLAGGPSPAAESVISHTGQNTSEEANQATPAPMQNDVIVLNGDPVVVPKTSQSSNREGWAVPAAIVLLLVIAAGVGFFVVYRRRRASRYHGLSETELGQVHRSI